jgi:hypothetical protein
MADETMKRTDLNLRECTIKGSPTGLEPDENVGPLPVTTLVVRSISRNAMRMLTGWGHSGEVYHIHRNGTGEQFFPGEMGTLK